MDGMPKEFKGPARYGVWCARCMTKIYLTSEKDLRWFCDECLEAEMDELFGTEEEVTHGTIH